MKAKFIRLAAALLCLLFCLALLPACKQAAPSAASGFSSLVINQKKQKLEATVTLNARDLQNHSGKYAYLYELLPGETTKTAKGAQPIASAKFSPEMHFSVDLYDGERSRLYSSFVVGFDDGSLLSHDGFHVQNPEVLATDRTPFLWASAPKGLTATDAETAIALHTAHVKFKPDFTLLQYGQDQFTYNGATYSYNESLLRVLDGEIKTASAAGLQVSLVLELDSLPDPQTAVALLSLLADRYSGDGGCVSAFFLDADKLLADKSAEEEAALLSRLADFCRYADLALGSRVANRRIYLHTERSLSETSRFFTEFSAALAVGGAFEFCMSVVLETPSPYITPDKDALTAETLPTLITSLSGTLRNVRTRLSVDLALIDAADADLQAATFAYHYLATAKAHPSMIFYTKQADAADAETPQALFAADGTPRRIAEAYDCIDRGLSTDLLTLSQTLWGKRWESLDNLPSIGILSGSVSRGAGETDNRTLFDFREGQTYAFASVGAIDDPELRNSSALQAPVLCVWSDPEDDARVGIRRTLADGEALKNTLSISVGFLSQAPAGNTCRAKLRLDGLATDGSKLTYEAEIEVPTGSWQSAVFQISSFVSAADLSRPCVIEFTLEDSAPDTSYPVWVSSILLRTPEATTDPRLPLILIGVGALLGFAGVVLIYCHSATKRTTKRRVGR